MTRVSQFPQLPYRSLTDNGSSVDVEKISLLTQDDGAAAAAEAAAGVAAAAPGRAAGAAAACEGASNDDRSVLVGYGTRL